MWKIDNQKHPYVLPLRAHPHELVHGDALVLRDALARAYFLLSLQVLVRDRDVREVGLHAKSPAQIEQMPVRSRVKSPALACAQ
jgi:hypothetical protein